MSKYKQLKDLPWSKAGTVWTKCGSFYNSEIPHIQIHYNWIQDNPDWFELLSEAIEDGPYPKRSPDKLQEEEDCQCDAARASRRKEKEKLLKDDWGKKPQKLEEEKTYNFDTIICTCIPSYSDIEGKTVFKGCTCKCIEKYKAYKHPLIIDKPKLEKPYFSPSMSALEVNTLLFSTLSKIIDYLNK